MRLHKSSLKGAAGNLLPIYLLLYFFFISNYFKYSFPVITFLVAPFHYISAKFLQLINSVFIHKPFDGEITMDDNYWLYVAVTAYFVLAVILTIISAIAGESAKQKKLFSYLAVYARFYLAFMMFDYGLAKVFGNQFAEPWPNELIQPLGNLNVHGLLWDFMGASRSYNFFAGTLEVMAGTLLLFKRTTMLGALAAIVVLVNVLMLNIGYDVQVKTMTLHLILIGIFILYPDFNRVVKFFFSTTDAQKKNEQQRIAPTFRSMLAVSVFLLVGYVLFVYVGKNYEASRKRTASLQAGLNGIYAIQKFHRLNATDNLTDDDQNWTKLAIMNGFTTIRFGADSSSIFISTIDTATKTMTVKNPSDSLFKASLFFDHNGDQYNFNGLFGRDSVAVSARKIDVEKLPLNKDRGKIQWVWY